MSVPSRFSPFVNVIPPSKSADPSRDPVNVQHIATEDDTSFFESYRSLGMEILVRRRRKIVARRNGGEEAHIPASQSSSLLYNFTTLTIPLAGPLRRSEETSLAILASSLPLDQQLAGT